MRKFIGNLCWEYCRVPIATQQTMVVWRMWMFDEHDCQAFVCLNVFLSKLVRMRDSRYPLCSDASPKSDLSFSVEPTTGNQAAGARSPVFWGLCYLCRNWGCVSVLEVPLTLIFTAVFRRCWTRCIWETMNLTFPQSRISDHVVSQWPGSLLLLIAVCGATYHVFKSMSDWVRGIKVIIWVELLSRGWKPLEASRRRICCSKAWTFTLRRCEDWSRSLLEKTVDAAMESVFAYTVGFVIPCCGVCRKHME